MSQAASPPPYEAAHKEALERGEHSYIDPQTGFLVFTELYLQARGFCCQSACRHCPYGFTKGG